MSELTRLNWDGDYATSLSWGEVRGLQSAARERRTDELFGIGRDRGWLALFATTNGYNPETREPRAYNLKLLTTIPLPGSVAVRRDVPKDASHGYQAWPIVDIDPRTLVATQASVRRDALGHYMEDTYPRIGIPFDRVSNDGNDNPVVIEHRGRRLILTGHHRSVAALLRGQPVTARYRNLDNEQEGHA